MLRAYPPVIEVKLIANDHLAVYRGMSEAPRSFLRIRPEEIRQVVCTPTRGTPDRPLRTGSRLKIPSRPSLFAHQSLDGKSDRDPAAVP